MFRTSQFVLLLPYVRRLLGPVSSFLRWTDLEALFALGRALLFDSSVFPYVCDGVVKLKRNLYFSKNSVYSAKSTFVHSMFLVESWNVEMCFY